MPGSHHAACVTMAWIIISVRLSACDVGDWCAPNDGKYEIFKEISESSQLGDVIFTVDINGTADHVALTSSHNAYFSFNTTSREIYLNGAIDADGDIHIPTFIVSCKDRLTGQVSTIKVNVKISDANDHAPVFTLPVYNLTIGEMTKLTTVIDTAIKANDLDATPAHNLVFYQIAQGPYGDYFLIANPLSADLTLQKELDYETLPEFSISIIAEDRPPDGVQFTATCFVHIIVKDEDDQHPVFTTSIYRAVVTNTATMDSVVPIKPPIFAFDPDLTINETVEYSFHAGDGGNILDIDRDTGVVTLVNKPTSSEVYLLVQATQVNTPSRYGVALLAVQVQGSNVNAPRFLREDLRVVVTELFPVNEIVTMVMASAADPGSIVIYSLNNSSNTFVIDENTGDITLVKSLRHGKQAQYVLAVTASDGELSASTTVTITVRPVNNHPPVILITAASRNVTMARRKRGDVILKVDAEDTDEGTASLTYTVLTHPHLFSVDSTGVLRVAAAPEAIVQPMYQVVVVVSDGGLPRYQTPTLLRVQFPATVMAAVTGSSTMIPIVLGVVAAILLIIIVILVVYSCRRRLRDKEHLDRVKNQNPSHDPKVLAFKQKQATFGRKAASRVNMGFPEETSDGDVTTQDNPLSSSNKGGYYNFGQLHSDSETDPNDVQVETSVISFDDNNDNNNNDNNNDNIYNNSQLSADSEDYLPMGKHPLTSFFRNGSLSTYRDSSGSDVDSINVSPTDSNDSKKVLVSPSSLASSRVPEENGSLVITAIADLDNLDADVSVVPSAQKQELTVYF